MHFNLSLSLSLSLSLIILQLYSPQEFEAIAPLPSVKSLILEGNPFCDQDFSSYASSIRKYFPNLELLVREGERGEREREMNERDVYFCTHLGWSIITRSNKI